MAKDSNWQIEHGCPQCGAPVTLDETDRLLACPFCRTRLYLVAEDHFPYYIPPAAGSDGELLYVPYHRLRGSFFSITETEVVHRFVDTSALAVRLPGLPLSLGLRPQALKLRFVSPATKGRFIAPDTSLPDPSPDSRPDSRPLPRGVFHRAIIGETVSLIHAPLHLRDGILYDAVLGRSAVACGSNDLQRLANTPDAARAPIRFVPTLCPDCGWDMEGERDSLVLICRNCNSAWTCQGDAFQREDVAVLIPPPEEKEGFLYLPFWRMTPRIEGMDLSSYADLIRTANLPKAITPAFATAPLYFWSPAFKVHPSLYLRWARQMTVFRPLGETDERLPQSPLYPVTLPLREAVEGIVFTLAQMIADKRTLYPKLAGLRITPEASRLEYHPFVGGPNELRHAAMRVAIDRTALAYGIRM